MAIPYRRTALIVALILAVVLGLLYGLLYVLPEDFFSFDFWGITEGATSSLSEVVRNLGLLAVAAFGLLFGMWRAWTAHRQTQASLKQARVAERGHLTDRFTAAVAQTGNEQAQVRLGGIYALWRLAEDDEQRFRAVVLKILCAYVRNPPHPVAKDPEDDIHAIKPEVQEILYLLTSRPWADTISDGLDLSRADLHRADLTNANLTGANLHRADLTLARLTHAQLLGANMTTADLTHANLTGANLTNAKLEDANLDGADLTGANLTGADLINANLENAKLDGANLTDADLPGADLTNFNLTGANMTNAYLSLADLTNANLKNANLTNANLEDANLDGADLTGANLDGANLTGADLTFTELADVRGLKQEQLDVACGHEPPPANLPTGLEWRGKPCPER